jgi:hypothetical protein
MSLKEIFLFLFAMLRLAALRALVYLQFLTQQSFRFLKGRPQTH